MAMVGEEWIIPPDPPDYRCPDEYWQDMAFFYIETPEELAEALGEEIGDDDAEASAEE